MGIKVWLVIDRALIVGLGSIGKRHLRLLRSVLPDADIRVLRHSGCGRTPEYADACFDQIGAACNFKPQLSVVASPSSYHLQVGMALAEAGSHLLVEKPVSDRAEGVLELVERCKARNLQFQVGYNLRFLESLQAFRAELAIGNVGTVYSVRCEIGQYLPTWRPGTDYRKSVSASARLGGGVLLELSHELDMLRWIFGEPEWVSAWLGKQSELEIDVEDCVMLNAGFVGGPVAQVGMDFLRRDATRRCTAIGELGTLYWDAGEGAVSRFDPEREEWVQVFRSGEDRDDSYIAQINAILSAIDRGQPNEIAAQGSDGLAVMELVAAAHRSNANASCRVPLGCHK
jgi:predicted dehydrogenase